MRCEAPTAKDTAATRTIGGAGRARDSTEDRLYDGNPTGRATRLICAAVTVLLQEVADAFAAAAAAAVVRDDAAGGCGFLAGVRMDGT